MELNAEQIKKALECCTSESSKCADCPRYSFAPCTKSLLTDALALITSQEQRIGAQDMTISELRQRAEKAEHDADRYAQRIKELTEENERLRGCVKSKEEVEAIMRATYEPLVKEIAKEQIDKAVTDTVRKMQERIVQLFPCDKKFTIISRFTIDQIAKKMLEGKEET